MNMNAMYHCVFSVHDSFEEQATQGSFVPHGRQDVLAAAIGRPEHPGRVRAAEAGVTIKQYFGSTPRTSRSASSLPPNELQQLTQQIRDQLEESITEKVTSQLQLEMQSQAPPKPLVGPGPSDPRVNTKGSCVDPSGNNPETGDSDRCDLCIEADPARLVAVGRVYEGSTLVHNTLLLPEVSLVGQALHTFLAWPTHLIKSLSHQVVVSLPKPPPKPDPEVDDPFYLMTLTIPELFLRPYQVRWDATVFGVINPDFPLYIKHKGLSEIAHGGQCLSISVLQLWILHLTETCMRAGNSDIYGFLEPQSIQRSGQSQFESESYIKSWMQSSQRDVYLGAYLNGPDNYLKGIINSAIKGLDDAPSFLPLSLTLLFLSSSSPLKLHQSSNLCTPFLLQIAKGSHFRSREAHLSIVGLHISEWYLKICRGDQETLGTSSGMLLPKSKLDQSRPNPGIIVIAAQFIHDRVEMECLEGVWETLEGNARCRFRGTIRLTATSLVHPEEPARTLQRTVEWILPTPTPYLLVEPVQVIEVTSSEEDPEEDPEELPPEPAMDALDFLEGDEDPLPEVDSPEDVMDATLHSLNKRLLLGGLSSRQKGTTECGYYVMHWMSTIILGSFRNNWEAVSLFQRKSIYL
ncbi:hypothetical protein HKD37_15G043969 [Glycine soja]